MLVVDKNTTPLDWLKFELEHCPGCQEVSLDVQEVQDGRA